VASASIAIGRSMPRSAANTHANLKMIESTPIPFQPIEDNEMMASKYVRETEGFSRRRQLRLGFG